MTFEQFLKEAITKGADVRLVPQDMGFGIRFYAHLLGKDGTTVDYAVKGDEIIPLYVTKDGNE